MAEIGDPFLLGSYGLPKRKISSWIHGATYARSSNHSDGLVTVTAQCEGIHVLDITSLHPIVSHTLGFTTIFSCPSVSRVINDVCTTYAVIESSPEIDADTAGRIVWTWSSVLSTGTMENKSKAVIMSDRIRNLYAPAELPDCIILVFDSGEVSVVDSNLADISPVASSSSSAAANRQLVKSFMFPLEGCSFATGRSLHRNSTIVVTFLSADDSVWVKITAVGTEGETSIVGDVLVPDLKPEEASDATCSASGFCSLLSSTGIWDLFQLEWSTSRVTLTRIGDVVRLANVTFAPHQFAVTPLSDSYALLAGITTSANPEVILLLWDLLYSAVVALQKVAIPSSASYNKTDGGIRLALVSATPSQAILILSPSSNASKGSQGKNVRSSVLSVPLTVASTSTIANAMGRASATQPWVLQDQTSNSSRLDPARSKLIETMRNAVQQNQPEAADSAFLRWADENPEVEVEHGFAITLLHIVLQPEKPAGALYSSKVIQSLLRRRAVTASMVRTGLLETLHLRQDWPSIILALQNVKDIPEVDIVTCLHYIIAVYQPRNTTNQNVMDVDTGSAALKPPTLAQFLVLCVKYDSSTAALRLAFRQKLCDAEDVLAVLEVLEQWMLRWSQKASKLAVASKQTKKNEHGVVVPVLQPLGAKSDPPPQDKILAFLHPLLDASFLTLLQHAPAHRVLRRLAQHLSPEIAFIDDVEQLRGPLEPFARAQAKALREGAGAARGVRKDTQQGDWRKKRKAAHEQTGMAVGVYQLEELVL